MNQKVIHDSTNFTCVTNLDKGLNSDLFYSTEAQDGSRGTTDASGNFITNLPSELLPACLSEDVVVPGFENAVIEE